MSYTFEFSQFLTFDSVKKINIEEIKRIFSDHGFQVQINNEIMPAKQRYFSDEYLSTIIEFGDELFFGEFDDWEEEGTPPPKKVQDFIDAFYELEKEYHFEDYKIILVQYADIIKSSMGIERIVVQECLEKDLRYASNKVFDYKGYIYIFSKYAYNNVEKAIDEITDLFDYVMYNAFFAYKFGSEKKIHGLRYQQFYHCLEKLCFLIKDKKEISRSLVGTLFIVYKKLYKLVEKFDESDSFYLELEKLEKYLEKLFWDFSLFEEVPTFDPLIGIPIHKFKHSEKIQDKIDSLNKKISEGKLSPHDERLAKQMLKKLQKF